MFSLSVAAALKYLSKLGDEMLEESFGDEDKTGDSSSTRGFPDCNLQALSYPSLVNNLYGETKKHTRIILRARQICILEALLYLE